MLSNPARHASTTRPHIMDASQPVPSSIGTLDDLDESPSQGKSVGVLPSAEAPLQGALKPPPEPKPKKPPKATSNADRTPGKSLLPLARVQKILRADKVRRHAAPQ